MDAAGCESEAEDGGRIRGQRQLDPALASGPSELVVSDTICFSFVWSQARPHLFVYIVQNESNGELVTL